jgi:hypothetical protein
MSSILFSYFLNIFIKIPKTPRIKLALVTTLVTDFPITSAVVGSFDFLFSSTGSTSTSTGALQVKGGAGIGLDFYVGGDIYGLKEITAYYGAPSDIRLKQGITPIDNGLAKVISLSGITYDWNELAGNKFGGPREAGVIAQEIQQVLPEAVVEKDDGYLTVKYDRIIPLLIEAIKELSSEIEVLKKKIQ